MSKYDSLWEWVATQGFDDLTLSFDEVEQVAGVPIDHSFLRYKKELLAHGYCVGKISLKERTVVFRRLEQ